MAHHWTGRVVAACAIAWLFLTTAMATTVVPPTFEEMTDMADLVFVGKAVSSRADWRSVGTDRVIFTLVEFETNEVLKGNTNKSVTLQFPDTGRLGDMGDDHTQRWIKKLALRIFYQPIDGLRTMVFAFPLWVALIFTLALERIIPAEPNRKILSVSFAHDIIWFLYEPVLHALVSGTYVALLAKIYRSYFSDLTFSGLSVMPGWMRFVVALLLLDLGYWVQHYINHKVPFLWKLHLLHHSQRQLNFFTDFRYHPLEYVVRHTFITIPFLFLSVDPPLIVGFAVVKEWYSRFYHGNIRTNLGPLKYILVTPQSHRVHHSLEAQHQDMNFGAIFSFWDFLFRKQYKGFDEYPATGIDDERFPHEQKISLKSLFLTPWLQMVDRLSRRSGPVSR
jgi:sterol desaturase/sphingolipid hydroxylase (fatty acid hydroxylase superfamily)